MELRQALAKTLAELMRENNKIVILDADLSKANGTDSLYKEFPNRCYNVGVSEQNMASMAAGLSTYGFTPVIVTFTPFATRRICDQIAVSIAYAKQKVVIIGTDPGITAEMNGGTHMSFEDVGVMRSIPKMVIVDIVDDVQLMKALPHIINYPSAVYVRMPRKSRPTVFDENYQYRFLKADVLKEGKDVTIIASGTMVYEAQVAAKMLAEKGIDAELISANCIKPLDEETILKSIKKTNKVLVCENHNVIGGLFSAVAELIISKYPVKAKAVGVMDEFGQVGKYQELLEVYHMTPADIAKATMKLVNDKE